MYKNHLSTLKAKIQNNTKMFGKLERTRTANTSRNKNFQ